MEDLMILRNACEHAKIQLSTDDEAFLDIMVKGQRFETSISRVQFEELHAEMFDRYKALIDSALRDAGLTMDRIDQV